ncbi:unnamed protein product, partial [Prorocentrum cordatum]
GEPCTRNPPFLPSNAQQRRQKHPKKEQCTGHTLYHRTTLGKIAITMRDPPPPSPSPLGTAEAIPAGQPGARLPRILRGGGPPAKRAQGGGLGGDEAPWQMHAFGGRAQPARSPSGRRLRTACCPCGQAVRRCAPGALPGERPDCLGPTAWAWGSGIEAPAPTADASFKMAALERQGERERERKK